MLEIFLLKHFQHDGIGMTGFAPNGINRDDRSTSRSASPSPQSHSSVAGVGVASLPMPIGGGITSDDDDDGFTSLEKSQAMSAVVAFRGGNSQHGQVMQQHMPPSATPASGPTAAAAVTVGGVQSTLTDSVQGVGSSADFLGLSPSAVTSPDPLFVYSGCSSLMMPDLTLDSTSGSNALYVNNELYLHNMF